MTPDEKELLALIGAIGSVAWPLLIVQALVFVRGARTSRLSLASVCLVLTLVATGAMVFVLGPGGRSGLGPGDWLLLPFIPAAYIWGGFAGSLAVARATPRHGIQCLGGLICGLVVGIAVEIMVIWVSCAHNTQACS